MDQTSLHDVRRFNRTVTQRLGALDESYLGRGRPLAQARLLFEIGPEGCDLKSLRQRLGLDSGYLSRLLGMLAADGLVAVDTAADDARRRHVSLSEKGLEEWRAYDSLSDAFARSILSPLGPDERRRLVEAMSVVDRLLSASWIELVATRYDSPEAVACLSHYVSELEARFETGFDAARSRPSGPSAVEPLIFLVARLEGRDVGCAALYDAGDQTAEIKRMWVAKDARGRGIARQLLQRLEKEAIGGGKSRLVLDTNRTLIEAMALYERSGFRRIERYNDNPYADFFYEKRLPAQS
jgi:DNA-binding MarR family transcriptional regulator/GNAT superfamily N-acetyltransferase